MRVEPADDDFEGSLQFIDEVKGGNVPKEYIPSVQKGFRTAMKNGVLAYYPVERLKVTLLDGSFHPVDSDQLSFELCAIQAFKKGSEKALPVLMEPIMKIEVVTPEESMGDVIGDLNKRRGQVEEWRPAAAARESSRPRPAGRDVRLRDGAPHDHVRPRNKHHVVQPLCRSQLIDRQERADRMPGQSRSIEIIIAKFRYESENQNQTQILRSQPRRQVSREDRKDREVDWCCGQRSIPLPTHKRIFTVNRSTFVNKKSREQFQLSSFQRLIDIYSSTSKTVDALMKLELPSGVDVSIKV